MKALLQPWQLLLFIPAGWIHRRQQDAVEWTRISNPSMPVEIFALSRFQSTECCAVAGRPNFFTCRDLNGDRKVYVLDLQVLRKGG